MLFEPRTFLTVANNSNLTQAEKSAIIAGAPLDATNASTAVVYFTGKGDDTARVGPRQMLKGRLSHSKRQGISASGTAADAR